MRVCPTCKSESVGVFALAFRSFPKCANCGSGCTIRRGHRAIANLLVVPFLVFGPQALSEMVRSWVAVVIVALAIVAATEVIAARFGDVISQESYWQSLGQPASRAFRYMFAGLITLCIFAAAMLVR